MRVYRVAHMIDREKDFPRGPYRPLEHEPGLEGINWTCDMMHPLPYDEGIYMASGDRCGCFSSGALRAWFAPWWSALAPAGYRIWVYDVPFNAVQIGQRQLAFRASEARLMRTEPCV